MPFTYRDKPKLADRFRGKTGEELLNELASDLDPDRRMFFDSPSWRQRHNNPPRFPRGFPFVDDRKRTDIRSYLDEIAARHPEFADQLREPPWDEDFGGGSLGRQGTSFQAETGRNEDQGAGKSNQPPEEAKEPQQVLTNFGLRNTVPLGPGAGVEGERHQRSMSAPPDNRATAKPKRFVTKCEIPIMHDPAQDKPANPPTGDAGTQETAQQKPNISPNVRVIPIQVEGREVPLVNASADTFTNFGGDSFREGGFEGRLPRDFGVYQRHSPRFIRKERAQTPPNQQQYAHHFQQYIPPQQHFSTPHFSSMPQQQQQQFVPTQPQPQQQQQQQQHHHHHHHQHHQQQQQQPQQQYQYPPKSHGKPPPSAPQQRQPQQPPVSNKTGHGDEVDSKPPPKTKPEPVKDPIEKVQVIQKEVEELMKQVESFKGNSRSDKQYLMLDELLTRQLLLLDNIDTEGKENIRQARKDTIRTIQRCISTLENKVPLQETNEKNNEQGREQTGVGTADGPAPPQAMDVDESKEKTPVANSEAQSMEVDEKAVKDGDAGSQQKPQEENK